MAYTTIDKPTDYFNTVLWTGDDSSSNAITGVGHQPDWLWQKQRNKADNHQLFDSVRGVSKRLKSNSTEAESTPSFISSFDSDGFTISTTDNSINSSSYNYVGWSWKAGGSASSNTDGDINSTVSANTTAGFSIVKWVGTGSNATIGHGLGVKPAMIITKPTSAIGSWYTYHKSTDATDFIKLNSTDATADNATVWNDTEPTTSVFTTGTAFDSGRTFIAYCFAEKKGYSKFGKYTGNGSTDGPFIYTGFKPAWVMIKRTDTSNDWNIQDSKRTDYNGKLTTSLQANTISSESTIGTDFRRDILSNGFKIRNDGAETNASGGTYIYMAFAESPFVTSTGIPTVAR